MGSFSLAENQKESLGQGIRRDRREKPRAGGRAEFAKDGNFGVEYGGAYHPKMLGWGDVESGLGGGRVTEVYEEEHRGGR
ncbi:hypothetical protein HAX54_001023 [Datura stramonium]|uniref:Uncharacterized protein n=1 Tax=Datura stramonium TaxID=4076 RepID=A0ABS8WUH3_DATST|nr:hypothetical protein [Datura stramonium]